MQTLVLSLLLAVQSDYDSLLERLRADDPGAYEKVLSLDRETGLRFLREKYSGTPAPAKTPAPSPPGTGAARDRYQARATLEVGGATIEVADEGLGRVEVEGLALRSPEGLRRFGDARFVSRDGSTVRWDRAKTVFEPVDETFAGARFQGFREIWTFRANEPFEQVEARGSWELGGTTEGLLANDGYRGWAAPPSLRRFSAEAHSTPEKLRTGKHSGAGFAFQASTEGALVQFAGARSADGRIVGDVLEQEKASGDPRLDFRWTFVFAPAEEIVLPALWTLRVTGPQDAESLWAAAFEFVRSKISAELGLRVPDPVTTCAWPPFDASHGFRTRLAECLDTTVREGFRCVLLDSIWRRAEGLAKHLVTAELVVSAEYGGVEGLRELVSACHAKGLEVIAWAPAGHLQGGTRLGESPVFQEHPDWKLRRRDGSELLLFGGDLQWGDLGTTFRGYFVSSLRAASNGTKLDGFWLDSYETTAGSAHWPEGRSRPLADALLGTLADLYAGGVRRLLTEGSSVLSLYSTWTFDSPVEDPGLLYRSMLAGNYAEPRTYEERYFAACAADAPWIVPFEILYGAKVESAAGGEVAAARTRIRETNRLFQEHRSRMRFRRTVPLGYEYRNAEGGGRLLWALRAGTLPDGRKVRPGEVLLLP
ncbi:MAG: hypothetical protein ACREIU_14250 [Planctomycetota bacterium]